MHEKMEESSLNILNGRGHNINTRVRDGRAKSIAGSLQGFAIFGQRLISDLAYAWR
jgi:hypothetical protein